MLRLGRIVRRGIVPLSGFFSGLLILCLVTLTNADALNDQLTQNMQTRFGNDGRALLLNLLRTLDSARDLAEVEQLDIVNNFFNQHVRFTDDQTLWQQNDYWATPLETLGARAGDCEDYTIAKYMALLRLGIPRERLRLIYVRAQIGGPYSQTSQAHMVLGYYESPTAMPLILDNLVARVQPATERPDLTPIFSFNSEGLWIGSNPQSQADPTTRLSRWRDLLKRAQEEGFYEAPQHAK
jgi:predicted transglutaminase-like cysteine proteinase